MTMTTAELTRQRYQLQRMTVLKSLQKFIKEPKKEEPEPDYFIQPTGPLSEYLR